jgi:hypothetical protein
MSAIGGAVLAASLVIILIATAAFAWVRGNRARRLRADTSLDRYRRNLPGLRTKQQTWRTKRAGATGRAARSRTVWAAGAAGAAGTVAASGGIAGAAAAAPPGVAGAAAAAADVVGAAAEVDATSASRRASRSGQIPWAISRYGAGIPHGAAPLRLRPRPACWRRAQGRRRLPYNRTGGCGMTAARQRRRAREQGRDAC